MINRLGFHQDRIGLLSANWGEVQSFRSLADFVSSLFNNQIFPTRRQEMHGSKSMVGVLVASPGLVTPMSSIMRNGMRNMRVMEASLVEGE